jgi:hypothetical protein
VADVCGEAVHAEADRQVLKVGEQRSVEEIRGDLWLSPEGHKLYDLARSEAGQQIYGISIHKSFTHAEAWGILRRWLR